VTYRITTENKDEEREEERAKLLVRLGAGDFQIFVLKG
jgi:hypothetical protein